MNRRRLAFWWALFGVIAFCLSCSELALAQRLSTEVSPREVEVGETFVVELTALVDTDSSAPVDPKLALPPGLVSGVPSVSTQSQVSIVNGRVSRQKGLTARWSVTATKPGRYQVGPASAVIGGRRLSDDAQTVEVVPPGSRPRRPTPRQPGFPFGLDPFDPFGSPGFPNPFRSPPLPDGALDEEAIDPSLVPEEWRVEEAPDPLAFLRARATPSRVVAGQPLSLQVYLYSASPAFDDISGSDVSRSDFLAYDVTSKDPTRPRRVPIGGKIFYAQKIKEMTLIPLKAGTFKTGEMALQLVLLTRDGRLRLSRTSEPVAVEVVEPPLKERPAGYRVGDTGHFQLRAEVSPREVEVGGAISVSLLLEGQGTFPSEVHLPERHGVEFSEPAISEDIEPRDGTLSGYRRFNYVVRLTEPGELQLGAVEHPYFNPSAGYETARAELGRVKVLAAPAAALGKGEPANQEQSPDALARLVAAMKPRPLAAPSQPQRRAWSDNPWFFAALLLGPLAVVSGQVLVRLGRASLERRRASQHSPLFLAKEALREAKNERDPARALLALERAFFLIIEDRMGLKARGILRNELESKLMAKGVSVDLARELVKLFEQIDAVRFAASGASEYKTLRERGERLFEEFLRLKVQS